MGEFGARRGKRLKIEWTGFAVHIDDKLWPAKEKPKPPATIDIEVEPKAIEFLVPKEVDEEKKLAKKNRETKKAGKSRKK